MKQLLRAFLVVSAVVALLLSSGCKSDSGSKEFIPGKGWKNS